MTRPLYESQQDRDNEQACIKQFCDQFGFTYAKLPYYKHIDYLLYSATNSRARAWVEIKVRRHNYGRFPTLLLSSLKWAEGLKLSQATGIPFWILIRWENGLFGYAAKQADVDSGQVWLEYGGRTTQTRDEGDIEPVMHIPIKLFHPVRAQASST